MEDLGKLPKGAWYHKCKPNIGSVWINKELVDCPECGMNQTDESVKKVDDFVKGEQNE